jgi:RHS repeat-associated protein
MTSVVFGNPGYYWGDLRTRTKTYNANGQLTSLGWVYTTAPYIDPTSVQYTYSPTQNNGQITQVTDAISGETVSYGYDALKRLTSASASPTSGSSATPWTQTFGYDGFGNLTSKVLNSGTNSAPAVTAATNRLTYSSYDANGNMLTGVGGLFTYDERNRLASAWESSGGVEYYGYAPDNKRIYRLTAAGTEEWTFYGAKGEKLGTFSLFDGSGYGAYFAFGATTGPNLWFAGQSISGTSGGILQDRLGSDRAAGTYYPYGEDMYSSSNGTVKFATYFRDSFTTLDYADQRYYASSYGRFNTPDTSKTSAKPKDPQSWNRYAYVLNDPVNHHDRHGLEVDSDDDGCSWDGSTLGCAGGGSEDPCNDSYWFQYCYGGGGGTGGGTGTAAQNGGGGDGANANTDFATAQQALLNAADGIVNMFGSNQISPQCDQDLVAVGVTNMQVATAAQTVNILNAWTDGGQANYASAVYGNSPLAGAAAAQWGTTTVETYVAAYSGTVAVAQLSGNNVYINSGYVNSFSATNQSALLLHELFHNITGSVDDVLQGALGLATGGASQNIGDKLAADCFQ